MVLQFPAGALTPKSLTLDELHDDDLFRYQFSNRRFASPQLTKTGEKIDVAEKLNDDYGQMCQKVYAKKLLDNIQLIPTKMIEAQLSPQNTMENISQYYGQPDFVGLVMACQHEERQIKMRMEEERQKQDAQLRRAFVLGRTVRLLGRIRW